MTSSSVTPLYGPHPVRLKRIRQLEWKSGDAYMQQQTRNGITLVPNPWGPEEEIRSSRWNVDFCLDTKRNPAYWAAIPKNAKPAFVDDGGPLVITKSRWTFSDGGKGLVTDWIGNVRMKYGLTVVLNSINDGGFLARDVDYPPSSDYTITDWHATAFSRLRPDAPLIDLFTSIIELRDLATLNFRKIRTIKDIADWWLAVNFGWKPLLADIMKMYKLYNSLSTHLDFLVSNNGKAIRRRAVLYEDVPSKVVLSDTTNIGINYNTWVQWIGRSARTSSWRHRVTRTLQTKVSASGSYIFYLKDIDLPETRRLLAVDLLGLRPTPANIWNALPWSWLIDWCSNIGDILDNISAKSSERCVAQYLYVMKRTLREYEWHGTDGWYTCSAIHSFESKAREIVHPYGVAFGSNLTSLQLSILAALAAQKF